MLPSLLHITDANRLAIPKAIALLPRGACIILREYHVPGRKKRLKHCFNLARKKRLIILIAGDIQMAFRLRADGVHIPGWQQKKPPQLHRKFRYRTASVHSLSQAMRAQKHGATHLLLSPIFKTNSHPGAPNLGLAKARLIQQKISLPTHALGGIKQRHINAIQKSGFHGVAMVDGLSAVPTHQHKKTAQRNFTSSS